MNILERHEKFEMEVLEAMRKGNLLDPIVFGGGTMLRLCHQLQRYSVDLDFFLKEPSKNFHAHFERMREVLSGLGWEITDAAEKHYSWLLELRRSGAPRKLKIEIRKDDKRAKDREIAIAFSPFVPTIQVRLTVCTLRQMWENKVEALIDRKEIRDAYDLEFLLRRGVADLKKTDRGTLNKLKESLKIFRPEDFTSKLGSLLPAEEKKVYAGFRFTLLEGAIEQALS